MNAAIFSVVFLDRIYELFKPARPPRGEAAPTLPQANRYKAAPSREAAP